MQIIRIMQKYVIQMRFWKLDDNNKTPCGLRIVKVLLYER